MRHKRIVVMGVSGCGKSTVGERLAEAFGMRFIDGDDLHPPANKEKMAAGIPLDDLDRWPWLDLVAQSLTQHTVIACSSLKRVYRDRIRATAPDTVFVHLTGSRKLLMQRIGARKGHFFKAEMLDSQLATLEPLEPDEVGRAFDIDRDVEDILYQIARTLTD